MNTSMAQATVTMKFEIQDGITLFGTEQSPCARRVRIALQEKNIAYKQVEVDLIKGENHYPEFVKISPNRKVPAIAFKNVQGVPDSILFESGVIIEYLDTRFPGPKLYPVAPWEKAKVKMWMDWELGLVDDHVPIMYQNVLPFVMRLMFSSKQAYLDSVHPNMPRAKVELFCNVYDGKVRSNEELEKHALASYENLTVLEKALDGKEYMVGDGFTVADITVLPRVQMFLFCGLRFTDKEFPNISRYLKKMQNRSSFISSESVGTRLLRMLMTNFPNFLVYISNFRSGKKCARFDGSSLLQKVLGECKDKPGLIQCDVSHDSESDVTVFDYPTSSDMWQVKILLREKGIPFKTVDCSFIDLIGRAAGSGSTVRVQHGRYMLSGSRTVLEYINEAFHDTNLMPSNPELKARVQCWQAWEQAMYINELSPLLEMFVISKVLVLRYKDHVDDLLALRSKPLYQAKFNTILKCFIAGLDEESALLERVRDSYSHLVVTTEERQRRRELGLELLHLRLMYLEESLRDTEYLVGGSLTLADICVFTRLVMFAHIGMKISAQKYPNVAAWMMRLQEREHFEPCINFFDKIFRI